MTKTIQFLINPDTNRAIDSIKSIRKRILSGEEYIVVFSSDSGQYDQQFLTDMKGEKLYFPDKTSITVE